MNEWQLQKELRERWLKMGALIDGEPLFLAGWEVMTNWEVNDAHGRFNLPSADFVLLDRQGRLVILELKMGIRSPGECLLALCQVTHSAVRMSETFTADKLAEMSAACRGGPSTGPQSDPVRLLRDAHTTFFSLSVPAPLMGTTVRRAVAACSFGPRWPSMVEFFTTSGEDVLRSHLESRYSTGAKGNRAMKRYLNLPNPLPGCLPRVSTLQIHADQSSDV